MSTRVTRRTALKDVPAEENIAPPTKAPAKAPAKPRATKTKETEVKESKKSQELEAGIIEVEIQRESEELRELKELKEQREIAENLRIKQLEELVSQLQMVNLEKDTQLKQLSQQLKQKEAKASTAAPSAPLKPSKAATGPLKPLEKDPARPKGAQRPFFFFCNEQREALKAEFPNIPLNEVSKIAGERWNALSEDEKSVYFDHASADQRRYKEELAAYERDNEGAILTQQALAAYFEHQEMQRALQLYREQKEKGKIKEVADGKPKKPATAYLFYCTEKRPALLEKRMTPAEASRIMGDEWVKLGDAARLPYERLAIEAAQNYKRDLQIYHENKAREQEQLEKEAVKFYKGHMKEKEALQVLKEMERQEKLERKTTQPRRQLVAAPPQGFTFFCQEGKNSLVVQFPEKSVGEITELLEDTWNDLTEDERRSFAEFEEDNEPLSAFKGKKPKRSTSAYMFFANEQRPKVKERSPGLKGAEITAMLAQLWRELPESKKAPYHDLANQDRVRFQIEKEAFERGQSPMEEE